MFNNLVELPYFCFFTENVVLVFEEQASLTSKVNRPKLLLRLLFSLTEGVVACQAVVINVFNLFRGLIKDMFHTLNLLQVFIPTLYLLLSLRNDAL